VNTDFFQRFPTNVQRYYTHTYTQNEIKECAWLSNNYLPTKICLFSPFRFICFIVVVREGKERKGGWTNFYLKYLLFEYIIKWNILMKYLVNTI
jgi:hypothetical protein